MRASLRAATPFEVPAELVIACSDSTRTNRGDEGASPELIAYDTKIRELEQLFRTAVATSLASIPIADRTGRLNGITEHIAESVVASLLEDLGYTPLQQMIGTGVRRTWGRPSDGNTRL